MADPVLCLDVGITQTRVWLLDGQIIQAKACTMHGIRDGSAATTAAIDEAVRNCLEKSKAPARIRYVAAAGMVTSELGPYFAPHLQGPAGLSRLAEHVEARGRINTTEAPLYIVRGVRFGNPCAPDERDAMRGEESLFMGLLRRDTLKPGNALLNLGSHWKLILSNLEGEISASYTGIGGELALASGRETILKSLLPAERPLQLDATHLQRGVRGSLQYGLGRALFLLRMNSQDEPLTPAQAYWQMLGAIIADALRFFTGRLEQADIDEIAITGYPPLAEAWASVLEQKDIHARVLTDVEIEKSFCAGVVAIVDTHLAQGHQR